MKYRISLVVLSCIVSLVTGLVIARSQGPGKAVKANRAPVIGLSLDTLKEARWQADRDMIIQRAKELGSEVLVQSANSDDARQIKDIEALISRGVDVLIIVPHNGAAMAKGVKLAHEAGIPVIAYDRLITDCDLDLYITFDNVHVGELQAKYVADHRPADRAMRVIRIYGSKSDNNAFLFKQGQDNIIEPLVKSSAVKVIHEDYADDWKPENAKRIVNAAITKEGNAVDAVLVSNDGTGGGAIQALMEEGLAGKVLVTGQDAELAACQRIVSGTQSMTIYKPIAKLARSAVDAALAMARGKPLVAASSIDNHQLKVPAILLDVVLVTKENMLETVVKDGFHSYEAIYGSLPEALRPPKP